jgi:hypothetical protein
MGVQMPRWVMYLVGCSIKDKHVVMDTGVMCLVLIHLDVSVICEQNSCHHHRACTLINNVAMCTSPSGSHVCACAPLLPPLVEQRQAQASIHTLRLTLTSRRRNRLSDTVTLQLRPQQEHAACAYPS